jgi:hypothetical protein
MERDKRVKGTKESNKGIEGEGTKEITSHWIAMGFSTQQYLNTVLLI